MLSILNVQNINLTRYLLYWNLVRILGGSLSCQENRYVPMKLTHD